MREFSTRKGLESGPKQAITQSRNCPIGGNSTAQEFRLLESNLDAAAKRNWLPLFVEVCQSLLKRRHSKMLDRNSDGLLLIRIFVGRGSVKIAVRMKDYTMNTVIDRAQTIKNS